VPTKWLGPTDAGGDDLARVGAEIAGGAVDLVGFDAKIGGVLEIDVVTAAAVGGPRGVVVGAGDLVAQDG